MNDFVRLRLEGKSSINLSWTRPWPPPETLHMLMLGDGAIALASYEIEIPEKSKPFYRVTYSELPDDYDSSHLARGALYVDDPETWDGQT